MEKHFCDKKPDFVFITISEWNTAYMRVEIRASNQQLATTFAITHCPFCGAKLTKEAK